MNFNVLPDGEGFKVTWDNGQGVVLATVRGFATHDAALAFIADYLVKIGRAFMPTH